MEKKNILIAGGSGLLGQVVSTFLESKGYLVRILTRQIKSSVRNEQFVWAPNADYIDPMAFENVFGVIQLSGESIAGKRWNKEYKEKIYNSRVGTTKFLVKTINQLETKPIVFISTSAIGIYGDRPGEVLNEKSLTHQADFLANLCHDWELEAQLAHSSIRTSIVRIGLVLSKYEGILAKSILAARMGLVPVFGNGQQMYSWIHEQDLARIVHTLLENKNATGITNGVSPNPVSQKEFSYTLAKHFHPWHIPVPAPRFMLKVALGEFADSLFLSQNIVPAHLQSLGFNFEFPQLKNALESLIKKV
ncbi:MAG: TIGR01777 family oxidoreductase [Saprospiraceae bacterium]